MYMCCRKNDPNINYACGKKLSVWLIFIVYKQTDKYYVAKYLYGLQIRHLDFMCAMFHVHKSQITNPLVKKHW